MGAQETYTSRPASGELVESTQQDWTESEERQVKRKYVLYNQLNGISDRHTDHRRVDFILLPILGLAFFALQCDRGNIANALTDTITQDLHVTTNQINVGNSLLSAGIVVLEIPSNILLQKVITAMPGLYLLADMDRARSARSDGYRSRSSAGVSSRRCRLSRLITLGIS